MGPLGRIGSVFKPRPTLTDAEVARGLRWMTWEGMATMGVFSITTSGLMAAFALALGANAFQIGILAAIPSMTQPLQIPAILLVEKVRRRKLIAVVAKFATQVLWFPMALIPLFIDVPSAGAVSMLLALMFIRGSFASVMGCSVNPWTRDLVPQQLLGRYFSRRMMLINVVTVTFGIGGAFFIDYWRGQSSPEDVVYGYTLAFLFAATFFGLSSVVFMSLVPEPLMQLPTGPKPTLWNALATPLKNANFRHLMKFLLFWSFSTSLAGPFFAVYMLKRLEMPVSSVMLFSVLSQIISIMFLRVWGPLVDRFGTKAVLSLSASLFLLVILGWTFTTMPERYAGTIPLLIILHIFGGIAGAGLNLTVGTISMKMAPGEQTTSYLTASSLATSLGAAVGPILGGLFADFFSVRELALDFTWMDPGRTVALGVVNLTGYDFLFILAFVLGVITLSFLRDLREEGEVSRDTVLQALMDHTGTLSQTVSSVPGLNLITKIPLGSLRRIPGMDVAIGATAYQLAEMVKAATLVSARGRRATTGITRALERRMTQLLGGKEISAHGVEIARQAARGVVTAVSEEALNEKRVIPSAVAGIVAALDEARVDSDDSLYGIGFGIMQGTHDEGAGVAEAVRSIIGTAKIVARRLDVDVKDAMAEAIRGALDAVRATNPEAEDEVRRVLAEEGLLDGGEDTDSGT